jgi:hypothetical protein
MKHYNIILTKLQLRFVYLISGAFVQKKEDLTLKPETYVMFNLIDSLIVFGQSERD